MSLRERVGNWLTEKMTGLPIEYSAPARLADWIAAHEDATSSVWAVTVPTGYGWELWAPGSPNGTDFCYEGVTPAAASMYRTDNGCGVERLLLADVEPWLRSWVEEVTGGTVLDVIDGIERLGPNRALGEYIIFVRVGGAR